MPPTQISLVHPATHTHKNQYIQIFLDDQYVGIFKQYIKSVIYQNSAHCIFNLWIYNRQYTFVSLFWESSEFSTDRTQLSLEQSCSVCFKQTCHSFNVIPSQPIYIHLKTKGKTCTPTNPILTTKFTYFKCFIVQTLAVL